MVSKFLARLLGLWTPQQLPEPFHGRVENADYDVQPLSRGMVSISIYLPRDQMRIQPRLLRKIEDPCLGGNWIYRQLFNMGAQSIDVGFSGDKIEAIVPGEIVRVDKAFAEQVVTLMVRLRKEATGRDVAHAVERRSWAKETENTIEVDGEFVTFEFSSCLADTDAEAGTLGNLDVMVRTTPGLPPNKLTDNLWLEVPGQDELLCADAHGPFEGGIELSFALVGLASSLGLNADRAREWMRDTVGVLRDVNVFWGNSRETKLATLRCVRSPEND